jgi:hypothetical protein
MCFCVHAPNNELGHTPHLPPPPSVPPSMRNKLQQKQHEYIFSFRKENPRSTLWRISKHFAHEPLLKSSSCSSSTGVLKLCQLNNTNNPLGLTSSFWIGREKTR